MLYLVGRVLESDEYRDHEVFSSGGQGAQRVFHVGPAGLVGYFEGAWCVGLEEGLQQLASLVAAVFVCAGENRYLKVVGEPGRELLRIACPHIFGYRREDFVSSAMG